jgi:hypothetical protein
MPKGVAEALNAKGAFAARHASAADGLALHLEALRLARESSSVLEEARALDGASRSRALLGEQVQAEADLAEAVGLYRRMSTAERTDASRRLGEMRTADLDKRRRPGVNFLQSDDGQGDG